MLNVLWIVPGFSSSEQDWCIPALLDLARAMAGRCRLTIVSMRYPYRCGVYCVGGATVRSIGGAHRGPWHTPGIWRDACRAVKGLGCDVLHAFWAYEPGMIAACFSSRVPVVISLAGGEIADLPDIRYGLEGRLRTRIPVHWALSRARVVTAGSPFLVRLAGDRLPLRTVEHLPLGVDLQRWPIRRRDVEPPVIINVGSLEPVKGQAMLLEAFAEVLRGLPSARLFIAGAGPQRFRLEKRAADLRLSSRVRFLGMVPHHEMARLYEGSSLFVQASRHEAQGMALLEAAACGLPIVGTAVGALTNLAPGAAASVPVGDVQQLSAAITRILSRSDEAAALGLRARKMIEEVYAIDAVADRFLRLYTSLV